MSSQAFAERRDRVLAAISPGVLVVPSAEVAIRNNDVEHEYRQDSDFYYLTGFDEPESVLVLSTERPERYTLFVRPRDPERETWDGLRAGVEGAKATFGADQAFVIGELDEKLAELLENTERLYYAFGRNPSFDEHIHRAFRKLRTKARRGSSYPRMFIDPDVVIHEMRRLKADDEIECLQKAIDITALAHRAVMKDVAPGMFEYEAEAVLRGTFRRSGSERPAYQPIVGSGPNATILHYHRNDRRMVEGDLLLVDAGCEYGYYAADVTRTFPVSGKFSIAQKAVYDVVLAAQLASIAAARPGATLDDVHRASVEVITQGLIDLRLIEGPLNTAIEEERYKKYYMHKTSHYLGMDVHDVGDYFVNKAPRPLEPGVVITVEPGIYISDQDATADEAFRGIGVRIEDDVLISDSGCRVLSAGVPKTIADVEQACAP